MNVAFPWSLVQVKLSKEEKTALAPSLQSNTLSISLNPRDTVFEGYEVGLHKLVYATRPFTRPLQWELVCIDTTDLTPLLPYRQYEDFQQCLASYDIVEVRDQVAFYLTCYREYGLVIQKSLPQPVANVAEFEQLAVTPHKRDVDLVSTHLAEGYSLWWLEWGGKLSAYRNDAMNRRIVFRNLTSHIGPYKMIPASLRR